MIRDKRSTKGHPFKRFQSLGSFKFIPKSPGNLHWLMFLSTEDEEETQIDHACVLL